MIVIYKKKDLRSDLPRSERPAEPLFFSRPRIVRNGFPGERSSGRLVVATADVKCLLVPLAFLTKHNASNVWGRTVCSLNDTEPTIEQSFRKFVVEREWEAYRQSLVKDTFRKRESFSHR